MTGTTNARVAGFTFLFYIASGIASLALAARPQATDVLSVFTSLSALAQRAGLFAGAVNWSSSVTWLVWLPALVFEIALAFWLLIKGVAPARATL